MPKSKSPKVKGPRAQRPRAPKVSATAIQDDALTFSYEALPDAGSYIRLLAILDYDEAQPIPVRCELTTWPISEVPEYHAVSYTWGDPDHTTWILVKGTGFFREMGLVTEDSDDAQEVMELWASKSGPGLDKLGSAAANFTSRPNFGRVWIYQELFLGRQITTYAVGDGIPPSACSADHT